MTSFLLAYTAADLGDNSLDSCYWKWLALHCTRHRSCVL